ncbi:hypothetical protein ACIBSW_23555 [Actinoplanes sp. NPDC049668]|uniref:hypothetical protein n=1 Tax=unclassified Actinoplanes TaxID=2626549 RepID=UPI0033B8A437
MRVRRLMATGAAILIAVGGAGCSAGGRSAPAATRAPAPIPSDPSAVVAAAKARLGTESARFALDSGFDDMAFTGVVNAQTKAWEIVGPEWTIRRVGTDVYVRASGKTLEGLPLFQSRERVAAGGWARTRLPRGSQYSFLFNDRFPWNGADNPGLATDLTRVGGRSFSGRAVVPAKDAGATAAPVTIDFDVDEQGRFVKISSGAEIARAVFTFSDFGTAADITAPPPQDVADESSPFLALMPVF